MLCRNCGCYAPEEAIVCPECGKLLQFSPTLPEGGAESIRQGKRAREAARNRSTREKQEKEENRRKRRSGGSRGTTARIPKVIDKPEDSFADSVSDESYLLEDSLEEEESDGFYRRGREVYSDENTRAKIASIYLNGGPLKRQRRMINWVKVGLLIAVCALLLASGTWLFMKRTETGQKLMARMGRDATSTALWKVGEEMMDSGDIENAILNFEKAKAQDEEADVVDVDGLLLLGSAYEAAGMTDEAAALYTEIYTETPSRSEAYTAHIRILLASGKEGDKAKAGELMATAYKKTGEVIFENQRRDLLPAAPEVDLTAGYYETKKYIAITSYQGYDVYYTFDENAELPYGGTLFTERVFLDEGIHTLRAVAVNGELVSDELHGTYKIIMPSPQTPRCTLAPASYSKRQRVWLKPGLENENDTDIVIYYTVDGSTPDADSPIYTGDPIWLPTGSRVYLKAIAVNKYNKMSNMLTVQYKIEVKPYPLKAYSVSEDAPKDFQLYVTTMTEFQQIYGEGTLVGNVVLPELDTECRQYDYSWGYAVMSRIRSGWVLAKVHLDRDGTIIGPRSTRVGDTEDYVVSRFRDMGQVESPSGNRGLYETDKGDTGKIWLQDDGGKIIRYISFTENGNRWQLEYRTNASGTVIAIDMSYLP